MGIWYGRARSILLAEEIMSLSAVDILMHYFFLRKGSLAKAQFIRSTHNQTLKVS